MAILGNYFNHSLIKITSRGLTINTLHGNKTYCNAPVVAGFYRLLLTVSRTLDNLGVEPEMIAFDKF